MEGGKEGEGVRERESGIERGKGRVNRERERVIDRKNESGIERERGRVG